MSEKLKPCPLCGGDPEVIRHAVEHGQFVRCVDCSLTVGIGGWDKLTRVDIDAIREVVREMGSFHPHVAAHKAQLDSWAVRLESALKGEQVKP